MKTIKLVAALSLGLAAVAQSVFGAERNPAPESPQERISTEARHILASLKESQYSHTTHVDESEGVYDLDCSGLLCYVLKQVSPEHLKQVPASKRHARPLALQFYETFVAATTEDRGTNGWQQIARLRDARSGDVLTWRREEQKAGQDTGHVMIVDEAPVPDGDGLFRVRVIDSSESPHGKDTRSDGVTGVGRGTMWFQVDEAGRITGYHWKLRNGKLHEMAVVVGRAVPIN